MTKLQRPIQAVLWDIDGTLIDSEQLHYQVIADWCKNLGYQLRETENRFMLGKSMAEKWAYLSSIFKFSVPKSTFYLECAKGYCARVSNNLTRNEPLQTFKKISTLKIPQACVSNGDLVVVNANLKTLEILHLVDFCITGEGIEHGKPHPEPYLLAAKKLGLPPNHCLAIEDSIVGVQSATDAGIRTVAWPLSNTSKKGYEGAEFFIDHPSKFPWKLIDEPKVEG